MVLANCHCQRNIDVIKYVGVDVSQAPATQKCQRQAGERSVNCGLILDFFFFFANVEYADFNTVCFGP